MPSQVLFPLYLVVMGSAAVCFTLAFRVRKTTPRHMRWALTGLGLDLLGTVVVLLFHKVLGWPMAEAHHGVVLVHRAVAVGVTCLLLTVAFAGWRRWRIHPRLGTVLLPLYWFTLALAVVGYWPYG